MISIVRRKLGFLISVLVSNIFLFFSVSSASLLYSHHSLSPAQTHKAYSPLYRGPYILWYGVRHERGGWLADKLNDGRLDYFYWLLAVVSAINLVLFTSAARGYVYKEKCLADAGIELADEESIAVGH